MQNQMRRFNQTAGTPRSLVTVVAIALGLGIFGLIAGNAAIRHVEVPAAAQLQLLHRR